MQSEKITTLVLSIVFSIGLIIGCYYWYQSTEDTASRVFSIIVPIVVIGSWISVVIKPELAEGGRRKRKLR
jgi:hypothetical protein